MKRAGRLASALVGSSLALVTVGAGSLAFAPSAAAAQSMAATTWVNMRSAPSTGGSVLTVLAPNQAVTASGTVQGGWHQVTTSSGATGWVYRDYLKGSSRSSAPTASRTAPMASGSATTTSAVNVRSGPGTSHAVVGVAQRGATLSTTGKRSGGWTEVIYSGQARWISTSYLTNGKTATALSATVATSTVYVNVGSLYVRATSAANGAVVATVHRGAALQSTGVVSGDRLQVMHNGATRWVYRPYVRSAAGAATAAALTTKTALPGYDRLNSNAKTVAQHVMGAYPQIRTIGGWRSSSNYSSDHPNGRAVDIMVPNWSQRSGIDYGTAIARDLQANAAKYQITYIIWRQQSWNASYPERGWSPMEDRGSSTANHYDHVHVSVRA